MKEKNKRTGDGSISKAIIKVQYRKSRKGKNKGKWTKNENPKHWNKIFNAYPNQQNKIMWNEVIQQIKEKCPYAEKFRFQLTWHTKGFQQPSYSPILPVKEVPESNDFDIIARQAKEWNKPINRQPTKKGNNYKSRKKIMDYNQMHQRYNEETGSITF